MAERELAMREVRGREKATEMHGGKQPFFPLEAKVIYVDFLLTETRE